MLNNLHSKAVMLYGWLRSEHPLTINGIGWISGRTGLKQHYENLHLSI
jgi:hypothetical protein